MAGIAFLIALLLGGAAFLFQKAADVMLVIAIGAKLGSIAS
jgi:hypothetical protein